MRRGFCPRKTPPNTYRHRKLKGSRLKQLLAYQCSQTPATFQPEEMTVRAVIRKAPIRSAKYKITFIVFISFCVTREVYLVHSCTKTLQQDHAETFSGKGVEGERGGEGNSTSQYKPFCALTIIWVWFCSIA